MILTLTLTPEQETRLNAQAAAHGQAADQYALNLLDAALGMTVTEQKPLVSREEWLVAFNEWVRSHDPEGPVLLDDRREVIYED